MTSRMEPEDGPKGDKRARQALQTRFLHIERLNTFFGDVHYFGYEW